MSTESQGPAGCCSTSPAREASAAEAPASAGSGCCGTPNAENPTTDTGPRENLLVEGSDDMTTCPVMVGNPVDRQASEEKGLFRDYDGQRYWLCCPGCGPAFDSDPAKYAANIARSSDAGPRPSPPGRSRSVRRSHRSTIHHVPPEGME